MERRYRKLFMSINIEELYTKYGPMVLRRCRYLLKNEEKSLDAMQDVFVNLISNCDTIETTYPSSLLYRIATNLCLNIIRNEKRHPETIDNEIFNYIADYNDPAENISANDLIDSIFRNEKPSTKEIAIMLYIDKMTLEQTAFQTGLSVSGIRKRMRVLKEKVSFLKEEIYEN
jgi:RNA polymerase sigma-70 factor (ECF subfamily)